MFLNALGNYRNTICYSLDDIKGIPSSFCTHRIHLESESMTSFEHQRRLDPNLKDVVRKEVLKLLDPEIIYPISDGPWVLPMDVVPKKLNASTEEVVAKIVKNQYPFRVLVPVTKDGVTGIKSNFQQTNQWPFRSLVPVTGETMTGMDISGVYTGHARIVTGMTKKEMKIWRPYRSRVPVMDIEVTGTRKQYKRKTLFSQTQFPPPSQFFSFPPPFFPISSLPESPIKTQNHYHLLPLPPFRFQSRPQLPLYFSSVISSVSSRATISSSFFLRHHLKPSSPPSSVILTVQGSSHQSSHRRSSSLRHLLSTLQTHRFLSFSNSTMSSSRTRKQFNDEAGNSSNQPKRQGFKRTKSKSVKRTQEAVNLERLTNCEFVQTRWAHKDTLERLGLLEDVTAIMTNIGIERMLDMDYSVHKEESAHLLASFELDFNKSVPPKPIEELGCIRFRVRGRNYELSLKGLCEAYGFRTPYVGERPVNHNSDMCVWYEIGYGDWKGSKGKAATIRNPSIRYVHKLLSQTIFARHEADKVKEDELALLAMGIKPFIAESLRGRIFEELNVGLLLARQIKKIRKEWVPNQSNGSKVYIGGFLTPILLACKVPLEAPSDDPKNYLDLNNLVRIHFLSGRVEDSLVYKFTTLEGETARVQLPNLGITSLLKTENVRFRPHSSFLLKETAAPESPPRQRKGKGIQREDGNQAIPLGSSRYYHPRYEGKATGGVKHALEGVEKNQRKGKWLSKSLHNINASLRKKIKSLEGTVSDLKSIVETFVLRRHSPPRNDDGPMSYEAALEVARRNSISHPLSFEEAGDREGPRASDYERRQRRRRHRHIPTPSPPSSDNELYHLSDSYTEG